MTFSPSSFLTFSLSLSHYSDSFLHIKPIFVSLYITQMCLLHYISRIVLIFSQLIALLLPLSYYLSLPQSLSLSFSPPHSLPFILSLSISLCPSLSLTLYYISCSSFSVSIYLTLSNCLYRSFSIPQEHLTVSQDMLLPGSMRLEL